ncbi:AsmA family protein, partial [Bordetella petrii]|uniref:AsmA family protein n=1 Tax=Bordetella petrii TaxID=94624 RepID=UPI001E3239B2
MAVRMPRLRFTRRFGKILLAIVAVILILFGVAAWQVPKVLRGALTEDVAGLLGRQVQVGDISFNPFTLTVRAHDLQIEQPGGAAPLLGIKQLDLSASWMSLFWFAPVVDSVRVQQPQIALVREDVTRFNFSDIQQKLADMAAEQPEPPADAPKDDGPPRFSLNNLVVEGGAISLDDQVTGRKQQVDQIELGVPFISTFGYATDIDVQPRAHMRINGSPFRLDGVARPFDVVPASTLNLAFRGLELEKWADAWPAPLPVKLERALLDSDLQIVFEQPRDAAPTIRVVGDLGLRQLDVRESSGEELVKWGTLDLRRISLDVAARQLSIGQIDLWSLMAHTRRDASERVNWLRVIDKLKELAGGEPEPAAGKNTKVAAKAAVAAPPAPATPAG